MGNAKEPRTSTLLVIETSKLVQSCSSDVKILTKNVSFSFDATLFDAQNLYAEDRVKSVQQFENTHWKMLQQFSPARLKPHNFTRSINKRLIQTVWSPRTNPQMLLFWVVSELFFTLCFHQARCPGVSSRSRGDGCWRGPNAFPLSSVQSRTISFSPGYIFKRRIT